MPLYGHGPLSQSSLPAASVAYIDHFLCCPQNCSVAVCSVYKCDVQLKKQERVLYEISGKVHSGWIAQVILADCKPSRTSSVSQSDR